MLTYERMKELLHYNPETGEFTWYKLRRGVMRLSAGTISSIGYLYICIDRTKYLAHRLAWLYMTGQWPENQVDHANMNQLDNKWSNLRHADKSLNGANIGLTIRNTSGVKGVYWDKHRNKWCAAIIFHGVKKHLGRFDDLDKAAAAYKAASEFYFGEYARTV